VVGIAMTRDDIIRMAREAGYQPLTPTSFADSLQEAFFVRFAALVAAAEREACAKVCEETTAAWTQHSYNSGCVDCAVAIRARCKV
jgi:hypothetical protein